MGARRRLSCREEQMETAETSSTRPFSRFWQIKRPKCSFIKPGCGDASRSCRQSREEQPGRRLPRRQAEGRTVVFPNRSQGLPGAGWPGRPRPTLPHTPRHPNRGVHSQPCKEQQGPGTHLAIPPSRARSAFVLLVKKNKKKKVLCPNTTGQGLNTWTNRVPPTRPPSSAHLPRGETPTILKLKPRRVAPLL